MQCGVTCLQMICRYYKKIYSIYSTDTLHQYCFATNEGVSLLGISDAAKKLGLRTVCGRITVNQLNASSLPCILHWNQNHFVVLYKIRRGKTFYIADPGKGKIKYTKEEFRRHWISTTSQGEEAEGIHSFRFLMGYLKQYRRYFVQIALGLLVGSLLQLILPFLTQAIVDLGIKHQDIKLILGTRY